MMKFPKKFKSRPPEVSAIQFTGDNFDECCEFIGKENINESFTDKEKQTIALPEPGLGLNFVNSGDWIVKYVNNDILVYSNHKFRRDYEPSD